MVHSIKRVGSLFIAFAAFAIGAGGARADVNITFMELASGDIRVFGDVGGAIFDVTKPQSETFGISSLNVPTGYSPDLRLNRIGLNQSGGDYLFALTETLGGPVSDYVWAHEFDSGRTVIDFVSGDALTLPASADAFLVETGDFQLVGSYINDQGESVNLSIKSVPAIPEPETYLMLSVGLGLLGWVGRKQKSKAVA